MCEKLQEMSTSDEDSTTSIEFKTEIHVDIRSSDTEAGSSTPTSSFSGDADNDKVTIPWALKSVENLLAINRDMNHSDLYQMIEKCKQMVLESTECSDERKWLVRRLIELRLRAQEIRETTNQKPVETVVILGHHFMQQKYYIATSGSVYCDHCSCGIWTMLQSWYICLDCKFACHTKCMTNIIRVCVHVIVSEAGGYTYTKDICPERGLSAQAYRCAECNAKITFKSGWIEPRLCDYSGLYYCQKCHWNSLAIIPARVVRNWDMEPRKVSRAACQLLAILENKPVLALENLNQKLFTLVPDLSLLKSLREEIQMMKKYLVICEKAKIQGLPWKSGVRKHMIDNSSSYSLKDLLDLHSGVLMDEVQVAHNKMRSHITESCELCKARGHLCEICGNNQIIYPWDTAAISCENCLTIYHRLCWTKRKETCPKCLRIKNRQIDTNDAGTSSFNN